MTDESLDPAESPESDAVRRLLAEARHGQPIPGHVAARLDRVLADLAATPAATGQAMTEAGTHAESDGGTEGRTDAEHARGVVTRLPAQRRRQAAALLAAAAAIVVGGVVLAQHPLGGGSTTAGSPASSAEGDRFSAGDTGGRAQPRPSGPSRATAENGAQSGSKVVVHEGRVVVRRESFAADALAAQALAGKAPPPRLERAGSSCPAPGRGEHVVAALYDGAPAALVYHRPHGSTQVVDLVVCGSDRPIRSVTLPAP